MGTRMENPGWCHAMARDCERAAQAARTVELRNRLLDQAATWWRLAGEPPGYGDLPADGGDDGGIGGHGHVEPCHDSRRHA